MSGPAVPSAARSLRETAEPLPLGPIRPRGWLERQLRLQADGITGQLPEVWPDVGPDSGWLGGDGESWERGPYYLDGLVPLAHALGDETLLAQARPWIEWMLSSQVPPGEDDADSFGPRGDQDWWPRMVAAKVLVQHAEATDDERVVPFLLRWCEHLCTHLPQRPPSGWVEVRGGGEVPEAPFALGRATVLHAQGCEVPQWRREGASAAPPPLSPVKDHLPVHGLDLVPYGTARLRVTEFPVTLPRTEA